MRLYLHSRTQVPGRRFTLYTYTVGDSRYVITAYRAEPRWPSYESVDFTSTALDATARLGAILEELA